MASRPFQFLEKKRSKIRKRAAKHFEGLAALFTHSAGWRAAVKAGCKPVHFSLDGCPLSCHFSGSVATTSGHFVHKSERRTRDGTFIYALSADENSPALAAPRHASTALFSCRFKCPCPPRRQRHFHCNADRAYNTLHFASQSRVPKGEPLWKPQTTKQAVCCPLREHTAVCCQQPVSRSVFTLCKVWRFSVYGISEREKRTNDIR